MTTPVRIEVDGLPCWQAPNPDRFAAGITFRVGTVDELPPLRGLTHLVEHLAIFATGHREHRHNGVVDFTTCSFWAEGDRDEVLDYLRRCCAALADLPMERLDGERRVLRSEAGAATLLERLLATRYGLTGFGACALRESALDWAGADDVREWSARWFTRQNAALWIHGDPPPDLRFELPDGERRPVVPVTALPPDHPAFDADGTGGVALSMVVPRGVDGVLFNRVLSERLQTAIRRDAALGYAPVSWYLRLDGRDAHVQAGTDCADHHAPAAMEALWRAAETLAGDGPEEDEVRREITRMREAFAEDERARTGSELTVLAEDELDGTPETSAVWLAAMEDVDAAAVRECARQALATAILLGPTGSSAPSDAFGPVRRDPDPIGGAATYTTPTGPAKLLAGAGGLQLELPGDRVTIPAADLVGVTWWPDGTLNFTGRDGAYITIDPETWRPSGLDAVLRELMPAGAPHPGGDREHFEVARRLAQASGIVDDPALYEPLCTIVTALHDGEVLEGLVPARRRDAGPEVPGVLARTTARMLWLPVGDGAGVWHGKEELAGVTAKRRLRASRSRVKIERKDGDPLEFDLAADDGAAFAAGLQAALA